MRISALLAAIAACAITHAETQNVRVEFTSLPEGAVTTVNGKSYGATPVVAYLPAGRECLVQYAYPGYEPADETFLPSTDPVNVCHVDLKPVKGLLLVTSEPEGADISLDGYSLGETPRLVTTLDAKDVHNIVLHKNGYRDKKIEVKFFGRKPLVHNVKLMVDSGTVEVRTDPPGAEVILNGVSRGVTPVTVANLPKGHVSMIVRMKGYADVVRDISVSAGESEDLFIPLEELPGSLKLVSQPEGAMFYINGHVEGRSPVFLEKIKSGSYSVRAVLDGHAPVERMVTVSRGELATEEFELANILGRLELKTTPVGASVYLDGRLAGITKSQTAGQDASDVLTVKDVKEGTHTLIIKKKGFAEIQRNVVVEASKPTQLTYKMHRVFTPNIRITTDTRVIDGVLVSKDENTVYVETSENVIYPIRKDSIRAQEILDDGQ